MDQAAPPATAGRSFTHRETRGPAPPVAWWARDFPGTADQVGEARHWIADLLPDCDPREDVLLLASELSSNAVVHTRSGSAGGSFSVTVEWSPELARVVVGDQGGPSEIPADPRADGTAWTLESGRGLWLVDAMAANWGTASHRHQRWVWFDIGWRARGGPPLAGHGTAQAPPCLPAAPLSASGHLVPPPGKRLRKETRMMTTQCACGFTELDDETLSDHLQRVFEPADRRGNDGRVHEEGTRLACVCGFAAVTGDRLDQHFLAAFTPPGGIGRDGRKHAPAGGRDDG
jgi:serine/threonine-protein kinase RsbW